jgi:hypothetical protein
MTNAAPVALEVYSALPAILKRDLIRSRASDKSLDVAIAAVADADVADQIILELARGFIEASRRPGAMAIGPQLPARLSPFLPGYSGYGAPGEGPIGGPSPRSMQPVARLPYSLFASTELGAGIGKITNADPQQLINGEQYEFVVTHVTFSEGREPVVLVPSYAVRIALAQNGKQWSRDLVPASSFLSYQGSLTNIPTAAGVPLARWKLAAPYTMSRYGSIYCTATNESAQAINAQIGFVAYKRDGVGTPRVFASSKALAANTIALPFNSADFRNDGDADADITDVLFSSGPGEDWGAAPTSPIYLIRPDGNTGSTKGWTGNGQNGASAVNLNTTSGQQGSYWELVTPQRVAPGTTITVEYANASAGVTIANIGFVGYLEVRQ